MESFVVPGGQVSFGVSVTMVSLILIGAGSVDVSARPILPTTIFTAGSAAMMRSCWTISSVAFVSEMLGSVMGIHIAVSSSRGGMNSDPIVVAMYNAEPNTPAAIINVMARCLIANPSKGR